MKTLLSFRLSYLPFRQAGLLFLIPHFLFLISYSQSVGIGTNTPNASALLDVSSTTKGLLIPRMSNTQMNAIVSPAPGLLVFNLTDSLMYVRKNSGWSKLIPAASGSSNWTATGNDIYNSNTGNIGIGTSTPSHAKMEINGSVGAAVAMFGADKFGVAIEADNPEVGFNYFYNNGTKTIKAGYASLIGMSPGTGEFYIGNFTGNQSSSNFGAITGYRQNITLFQSGEFRIAGSSNFTHFYYGGNEDTYIRGGKDFSNVFINDITGGRVGIGTSSLENQTILTIKGSQFYGGIDVTANGGPIGAIYAHGLNGAPALYLDGPIKVNTLASNRTAYRLFTQNSIPGADGYTTAYNPVGGGFDTQAYDGGDDILINNPLCNGDPNVLIFFSQIKDQVVQNYKAFLHYDGTYWHIRSGYDKIFATDLFDIGIQFNILIIKTN